jgi:hypothetical protein
VSGGDEGISTELLNALADGELTGAERERLLARLGGDPAARARLCAVREAKARVAEAYPPLPEAAARRRRRPAWPLAAAAAVLLAVALAGVLGPGAPERRMVLLDPLGVGARPAAVSDSPLRIVFHVVDPSQTKAGELLEEVEGLLDRHRDEGLPLRVEVVAHGEGLALLRAGLSRHRERIATLAGTYPNLTFVACHNTVTRLQVEEGIAVTLIPEAEVTRSGVAHVVRRQQEGWAYIQV